jgi:PilZ domain
MSELTMSEHATDHEEEVVVSLPDESLSELIDKLDASWQDSDPDLPASEGQPAQEAPLAAGAEPGHEERRRSSRRAPEEFKAELRLAVAGSPMRLLNLSSTGLLAETNQRLCPGRRVDVFLRYGGARRVLRATVVRSSMYAVAPSPVFRAALEFEEALALPDAPL